MISELRKEIVRLLSKDNNTESITFVGSLNHKKLNEVSDIDIVVICNKLSESYFKKQINLLSKLNKKLYISQFEKLYINTTFGPLKFNDGKTLVLHLMIYDIESHKNHVVDSPFTTLDWALYESSYGKSLKHIYPVFNIQLDDFRLARRSINDYKKEFESSKLSYREYNFSSNYKYKQEKKFKKIDNIEMIEFINHILKFSLFNLCKFKSNENKLFNHDDVFKILPEFLKFKSLLQKLDRTINDLNTLNLQEVKREFVKFIIFFDNYLKGIENNYEKKMLYFIRHSETRLNDGTFLGINRNPDIKNKLTSEKIEEFKNLNINDVFSSPLKRARSTALQLTDKIYESKLIQEINYGKAEGMDLDQFYREYPHIKSAWLENKDPRFPLGENLRDVEKRLIQFLKLKKSKAPYIAFTHQVVIRVAIAKSLGLSLSQSYILKIDHEFPYKFYFDGKNIRCNIKRKHLYKIINYV